MLKSLLPNNVKANITIDDIRLKSNINNIKTIRFTDKSFCFFYFTVFTDWHSGLLGDIPGFVQLIPGSYKSDKPNNITGIDEVHLIYDCINCSFVNGNREPVLYSFGLASPPSQKIYKEPIVKLFKRINKLVCFV